MLLPKDGLGWKAARSQLPPARAIWVLLTKTRFLFFVAMTGAILLLWRGISTSAGEMQRYRRPMRRLLAPERLLPWEHETRTATAAN